MAKNILLFVLFHLMIVCVTSSPFLQERLPPQYLINKRYYWPNKPVLPVHSAGGRGGGGDAGGGVGAPPVAAAQDHHKVRGAVITRGGLVVSGGPRDLHHHYHHVIITIMVIITLNESGSVLGLHPILQYPCSLRTHAL